MIGRSGSGKSTHAALHQRAGTDPGRRIVSTACTVNDPNTNLRKLRQQVGIVFQSFNLFPHLSVERQHHARADAS